MKNRFFLIEVTADSFRRKENLFTYIKTVGEEINLDMIIIGIAVIITIFSIEVQLRKLNKTNEMIVELLREIKNKE
jgi:hypothetical protein